MNTMAAYNAETFTEFVIPLRSIHAHAVEELIGSVKCPRSELDVYSFAIDMESYLSSVFAALANTRRGSSKMACTNLAFKQLERKEVIAKVNNDRLNIIMQYFYTNGGPIIEPPVNESRAKEIEQHFTYILANFIDQMDILVRMGSTGNIKIDRLADKVKIYIIDMYKAMEALYWENDMQKAFDAMIAARCN